MYGWGALGGRFFVADEGLSGGGLYRKGIKPRLMQLQMRQQRFLSQIVLKLEKHSGGVNCRYED